MRQSNIAAGLVVFTVLAGTAQAAPQPDLSSSVANTLTHIGISVPVLATAGLMVLGDERQEQVGRQGGDALLATGAVTLLLKEITRQPRPNDLSAQDGFPSGHASLTFAFARCLSNEYPDWGKLAYLWAAGVSWSRVRREDHSIAQVLAGAALGSYIADRSRHSSGGLLGGLIVKDEPAAFTSRPELAHRLRNLGLWQARW